MNDLLLSQIKSEHHNEAINSYAFALALVLADGANRGIGKPTQDSLDCACYFYSMVQLPFSIEVPYEYQDCEYRYVQAAYTIAVLQLELNFKQSAALEKLVTATYEVYQQQLTPYEEEVV